MIIPRPAEERGAADFGWLKARYSFSFAYHYDPKHMGIGSLRVLNQDRIDPHTGFPTHPHADMEIITYMLEGSIRHKDSMGNTRMVGEGQIQWMSAGTGVQHSEWNASEGHTRLCQIWIHPDKSGYEPAYKEHDIPVVQGKLPLMVSPDGRGGSLPIRQDAFVWGGRFEEGFEDSVTFRGHGYLHVPEGTVEIRGREGEWISLGPEDGAYLLDEQELRIRAEGEGHLLLFDLGPMPAS